MMFWWLLKRKKWLEKHVIVILVCISEYKDTSMNLRGPGNDLEDIEKLFRNQYGIKNILVLRDQKATKENILHTLENQGENYLIFFYSGHGARVFRSGSQGTQHLECLVTHDHLWDNPLWDFELKERFLEYEQAYGIFDCCHAAGMSRDGAIIRAIETPLDISQNIELKFKKKILNTIEIAACSSTEVAFERLLENKYRGVLSYHFRKILEKQPEILLPVFEKRLKQQIEGQTPQIKPLRDCIFLENLI